MSIKKLVSVATGIVLLFASIVYADDTNVSGVNNMSGNGSDVGGANSSMSGNSVSGTDQMSGASGISGISGTPDGTSPATSEEVSPDTATGDDY